MGKIQNNCFNTILKCPLPEVGMLVILGMENRVIKVYDAIAQMRELTKREEHFSIGFMSCDISRELSTGFVELPKVKLRSSGGDNAFMNSKYIINYLNVETNIPGRFYQILLMYFNGAKVIL